jgi:hypothetical protein
MSQACGFSVFGDYPRPAISSTPTKQIGLFCNEFHVSWLYPYERFNQGHVIQWFLAGIELWHFVFCFVSEHPMLMHKAP